MSRTLALFFLLAASSAFAQHQHAAAAAAKSAPTAAALLPGMGNAHHTVSTNPAHTAAPTATCVACNARGSAQSTIAAATMICNATRATTYHAPRCFVRTAHHTTCPANAYASSRCVQWTCCR